jgi:hypothetical protein
MASRVVQLWLVENNVSIDPALNNIGPVLVKAVSNERGLVADAVTGSFSYVVPGSDLLLVFRCNHKIHQKGPVRWSEHCGTILRPYYRVIMLNHLNAPKH